MFNAGINPVLPGVMLLGSIKDFVGNVGSLK
jgi:hypothetical protein